MKKCVLLLGFVATLVAGCSRNGEVASTDVADESPMPAAKATNQIYTVDEYDPSRDVDADLRETVEQAKTSKKRIILEIGGNW
ncbi:MAG: hypothetical protein P1U77_20830 [Rubripirellula sp.]|jgi:lysyl-tRNA synthetase class I|nr:hypothetical protein [Rubripirellula sp.]